MLKEKRLSALLPFNNSEEKRFAHSYPFFFAWLTDLDECSSAALNSCSQICKNSQGSFQCACDDGFNLQADNTSCSGKT